MSRALADTSVFIAREAGRPLESWRRRWRCRWFTTAELELGVLRARSTTMRARRLATLARVRESYPLVQIDGAIASSFARLAAEQLGLRRGDHGLTRRRDAADLAVRVRVAADGPSLEVAPWPTLDK